MKDNMHKHYPTPVHMVAAVNTMPREHREILENSAWDYIRLWHEVNSLRPENTRLQDENERLRAALKMIKDWGQRGGCDPIHLSTAAEGALEGESDGH